MVGPGARRRLIAIFGVEPCFLLNAASFAAMLIALGRMEPARAATPRRAPAASRGQLRAALR